MAVDNWVRKGHPVIFGTLIACSIIELAISAWLTARFHLRHDYTNVAERDKVRYTLFCTAWTIAGSGFFLILFLHSAAGSVLTSVLAHLIYLSLTWIFWVAAAIAITTMLGGGLNCSKQDTFVYCTQLNALEAFAWIIWIIVTFTLIFVCIRGISAARRGDGYRGGLVA
ncbi:hypothetical protein LshimejAT787_1402080 [Lyophyllum shimeji]|uniref:MARVEL domain-containing protein n=1 Tax=Lyophyllum shimeji TaxID=47721 RepID=A0A9P3PZ01_LYOSH|nr:hypothetical protein LshimejAT787_1402080 [Lyophyllum shimeji]